MSQQLLEDVPSRTASPSRVRCIPRRPPRPARRVSQPVSMAWSALALPQTMAERMRQEEPRTALRAHLHGVRGRRGVCYDAQ